MLLTVWEMCSSFYIAHAMIGRKETNDSLEKKKSACLKLGGIYISFSRCRCFLCFCIENGLVSGNRTRYVDFPLLIYFFIYITEPKVRIIKF